MSTEIKVTCIRCERAQTVKIQPGQRVFSLQCPECGLTEFSSRPFALFTEHHRPIYRIYQAQLLDGEMIKFSVNNVREVSLRKEIEIGEKLILPNSLLLEYETFSRNEARSLATEL